MMEAIFSGQHGAKMAGVLLGGGVLPVLALLFAFPNGEYFDGVWISLLGIASAAFGWRGWRANRRSQERSRSDTKKDQWLLTPAQHRAKQQRRAKQRQRRKGRRTSR
jgi:hypothetical protein